MHLAIHYLPQFVAETELADHVVVMVDLLRASTTICQALKSGAKCVVPCVEVDQTLAKAERYERSHIVLGGERGGERIPGFDLGNSPADYTADQVFNRTVLFTTTNGTKALAHAHLARQTLIGAALNRQAVVAAVAQADHVDILCAGTGGKVTREDLLVAGAIGSELLAQVKPRSTNPWCDSACREWQELLTTSRAWDRTPSEQLAVELQETLGGKNLLALGYDNDLTFCAQLDTLDFVPELDRSTGQIRLP